MFFNRFRRAPMGGGHERESRAPRILGQAFTPVREIALLSSHEPRGHVIERFHQSSANRGFGRDMTTFLHDSQL